MSPDLQQWLGSTIFGLFSGFVVAIGLDNSTFGVAVSIITYLLADISFTLGRILKKIK